MRTLIGVILGLAIGIIGASWWDANIVYPVPPPNYDSVKMEQRKIDMVAEKKTRQDDSLAIAKLTEELIKYKATTNKKHLLTDKH